MKHRGVLIQHILLAIFAITVAVACTSTQASAGSKTITPGTYNIITALNTDMAVDVPGGSHVPARQLQIYDQNYTTAQVINLEYKNGYYIIHIVNSNMVFDVKGGKAKDSVAVIQYPYNGKDNQKWEIINAGGGYFYIKSALGDYYLDVAGGNPSKGTKLQIYHGNGSKAQKFKFVSSVYYEYKTIKLNFNTFGEWEKAINVAQKAVVGVTGRIVTSPSGKKHESGAMIVDVEVLEYKTVNVTKQYGQNVGSKVTMKVKLPKKIRYKLHKHKFGSGFFTDINSLYLVTTCSCGYRDTIEWQIPWPDTSDAQKASEVTKVTYTNKYTTTY